MKKQRGPKISIEHRENFKTLVEAVLSERIALAACKDRETGKDIMVVCAVNEYEDGSIGIVPLTRMFDSDPYELLAPPTGFEDDNGTKYNDREHCDCHPEKGS